MSKILVVAAHPDDEVLGCGATMAKAAKLGHEVHTLILGEGETSRDEKRMRGKRSGELSRLAISAEKARNILGARSLKLHNFPDNRMDSVDLLDIVKIVERHIALHNPDTVYTHHAGDLNVDHRMVSAAVLTACRPVPGQPVTTLLFFEVLSSTEWQASGCSSSFSPNWFVEVSDSLPLKIQALKEYSSEMRPFPHPRSYEAVEHLARLRGASVGVPAAEAFILARSLCR